jgi:hypothetical protein
VTAILETHLHYANQYADMLEIKVNQLKFITRTRLYLFVMQSLMKTFGTLAIAFITIAAVCQIFGYKVMYPLYQVPKNLQLAAIRIRDQAK